MIYCQQPSATLQQELSVTVVISCHLIISKSVPLPIPYHNTDHISEVKLWIIRRICGRDIQQGRLTLRMAWC